MKKTGKNDHSSVDRSIVDRIRAEQQSASEIRPTTVVPRATHGSADNSRLTANMASGVEVGVPVKDNSSGNLKGSQKPLSSDFKTPESSSGLLSGAVAWKLCRDQLGKTGLTENRLKSWVKKLQSKNPEDHLDESDQELFAQLQNSMAEMELGEDLSPSSAAFSSLLAEYGICARRVAPLYEDSDCLRQLVFSLNFGDLYQITDDDPIDRGLRIRSFSDRAEGFLPRGEHLSISPGEFRVLQQSDRQDRLTFLVKILGEKNQRSRQ